MASYAFEGTHRRLAQMAIRSRSSSLGEAAKWRVTAINGAGLRSGAAAHAAILCRAAKGELLSEHGDERSRGDESNWVCVAVPGRGALYASRLDVERAGGDASAASSPAASPRRRAPRRGSGDALDALVAAFADAEAEEWPAGDARWPRVSAFGGDWRVHCVSDLHADMRENMAWLRGVPSPRVANAARKHCLIVAGDVATKLGALENVLVDCVEKFDAVFYCAGNHELWYVGSEGSHEPEAYAEAKRRVPARPPARSSPDKYLAGPERGDFNSSF